MNLLLRSLCIALALGSCQASWWRSSSSRNTNILDYVKDSNAVINAYIYRKDYTTGLYHAKIKRIFKGCDIEQFQLIMIDVGHGSCKVNLRPGQRYLLLGRVVDSQTAAYDQPRAEQTVFALTDCAPTLRFDRLSQQQRQGLRSIPSNNCDVIIPDDRTSYSSTCSRNDCGRLPYDTSAIYCTDGSLAGFTDNCIRSDNSNRCEWEFIECPKCDRDADCAERHICEQRECVPAECHIDGDCGPHEQCSNGRCVKCDCGAPNTSFQCHDGYSTGGEPLECTLGSNGCAWTYSTCADCSVDSDCVAIENGVCREGTCEKGECSEHSHCGNHEVCEYGHCVACECQSTRTEYLCHDGKTYGDRPDFCTRKQGRCEYVYTDCAPCNSNDDCGGLDYGICKNGQCEEGECYDNGDCSNTEVCEHGVCKPCECHADQEPYKCHDHVSFGGEPFDCKRQDYGQCAYSYTDCKDCQYDENCKGLGEKGVCKDGQCSLAQCFDNHHCADDELCINHHCQPCDCGPGDDGFLCHDLTNYGGKPVDCKRRDNGQCSWSYSSCEDCYSNQDCHALDNGVCKNGECVEAQCSNDHQCAHDEVCENHHCVKCDCGQPDRTPFQCHDGVSYGDQPLRNGCKKDSYSGVCSWHYSACPICNDDADCSALEFGRCIAGECQSAECNDSHDCGESEYCDNGFCVECDCGIGHHRTGCSDGVSFSGPDKCVYLDGQCQWTFKACPICGRDFQCQQGYECINEECVPAAVCDTNDDCERDEFCNYSGKCVKCDCGDHFGDDDKHECKDELTIGGYTGACIHTADQCEWEYISCPRCGSDYDCAGGLYCVEGFCSATQPSNGKCYKDEDCGSGHYCAAGHCLAIGSCQSRNDCYNPSNDFDYDLQNCQVPRLDCSYGECRASCCRRPTNCFDAPCDQQTCRDDKLATCANDYCGGCLARFFTYDGSPTCMGY